MSANYEGNNITITDDEGNFLIDNDGYYYGVYDVDIRVTDKDGNYIKGFRRVSSNGVSITSDTTLKDVDTSSTPHVDLGYKILGYEAWDDDHVEVFPGTFVKEAPKLSFQMTIGITYQTQPDLFDS